MRSPLVWGWSCWFFLFVRLGIDALLLHFKTLRVHSYYLSHPIYHLCGHQQPYLKDKENSNSKVKRKGDPDIQKMNGTWKNRKEAEAEDRRKWKIT